MADPFDLPDPFEEALSGRRRRRLPAIPPLSPEEADRDLTQLLQLPLSGLQYLGEAISKGGRAVRGTISGLTGGPTGGGLLNLIPFSDTLGITTPEEEVSGKKLLEHFSMLPGGSEGFLPGLAGFGADVLTDPASFLTFGGAAVGKAGKLAQMAGAMPKGARARVTKNLADVLTTPELQQAARTAAKAKGWDYDALLSQQLGGVFGFSPIPVFGSSTSGFTAGGEELLNALGTAARVPRIVPGVGPTWDFLGRNVFEPAGRYMTGLFNPLARDTFNAKAQQKAIEVVSPAVEAGQAAVRREIGKIIEDASKAGIFKPDVEAQYADRIRKWIELGGDEEPVVIDIGTRIKNLNAREHQNAIAMGADPNELKDLYAQFAHRSLTRLAEPTKGYEPARQVRLSPSGMPLRSKEMARREPPLKNLPGASLAIQKMARDVTLHGPGRQGTMEQAAEKLLTDPAYLGVTPAQLQEYRNYQTAARSAAQTGAPPLGAREQAIVEDMTAKIDQSKRLADFIARDLDPKFLDPNVQLWQHPILDAMEYNLKLVELNAGRMGVRSLFFENATTDLAVAGPKAVRILDAFKEAGLGNEAVLRTELATIPKFAAAAAENLYVPKDLVEDAVRTIKGYSTSEGLKPVVKIIDWFTNLFKGHVTAGWPGFHLRNATTGGWQHSIAGGHYPGGDLISPLADARTIMQGNQMARAVDVPYIKQLGITDPEQATRELANLAFRDGVYVPPRATLSGETVGGRASAGTSLEQLVPGLAPVGRSMREVATAVGKAAIPRTRQGVNFFGVAGVGGLGSAGVEDTFSLIKAGRILGPEVENTFRLGTWLGKMMQGYDPSVAAAISKAAHIDYGALTEFERHVMKRIVPFYCVPEDSKILTRDGWKTHTQLEIGEDVMTYNINNDCMEWQPCEDKAIFEHDQELMVIGGARREFLFTFNHRWAVKTRACTVTRPYGTYAYAAKRKIIEGHELSAGQQIIVSAKLAESASILTPAQARLLGWLVTDGSCRNRRGNYTEAVIYQHPKKFLSEVCTVAGGRPRSPHPDTGTICVPVLKDRKEEILAYLDKNTLISVVTRLSTEAAEAMYDAMYKADGSTSQRRNCDYFAAQHPGVRAAFRVLAAMLGKRTSESQRGCYISNQRFMDIRKDFMSSRHYKGKVWCPKTANGTWVMKQGGEITITGNTWTSRNVPWQLKELARRPGGPVATAIKGTTRLRQDEGFVPPYLGGGLAIPLGTEEEGQRRYFTKTDLPWEQFGELASLGPGGTMQTIYKLLGQTNPLIKVPLEVLTNKQFFTGRELEQLQPITGNPVVDELITGMPTSRYYTTGRTIADPRKGLGAKALNILTGAKVSDVDVQKQREITGQKLLDEILGESPHFKALKKLYIPPEQMAQATPEEIELFRLYRGLGQRAKQAAKEKRMETSLFP